MNNRRKRRKKLITEFVNQCGNNIKGNRYFYYAALLIPLFFSNNIYATNYYWRPDVYPYAMTPGTFFSSGNELCVVLAQIYSDAWAIKYYFVGLTFFRDVGGWVIYDCNLHTDNPYVHPNLVDVVSPIRRYGDSCPSGTVLDDDGIECVQANICESWQIEIDGVCYGRKNHGGTCGSPDLFKGNPINIGIGNKYQREVDYSANGSYPLAVSRSYNSVTNSWRFFPEIGDVSAGVTVNVIRVDGKGYPFRNEGGVWVADSDIVGKLTANEDGSGNITGWTYTTSNDQIEIYDDQGRILRVTDRNGLSHTYSYQTDSITVTHSSGDMLVYHLDSNGRVTGFTDPDNRDYQYSYDTDGRLVGITFPDDTPSDTSDNPRRIYHYESSSFPQALTGITDENGNRYATWSYDSQGRAVSSEHANGVDKTTLAYNADGTTTVTNPLGKQTTYHFTTINGVRKVTQVEGHPTASCEGANKSYQYDANGNVISKTDWNGVTTTYTYDMARNLELSRTEAAGTPQERIITTEWHPQFRLPTKITEPDRITKYSYDAQGLELSHNVLSVQ